MRSVSSTHPNLFLFFVVKFLFLFGIWKHLSSNGPLVHLKTISSEQQKESGHPTRPYMVKWHGQREKLGFYHKPLNE